MASLVVEFAPALVARLRLTSSPLTVHLIRLLLQQQVAGKLLLHLAPPLLQLPFMLLRAQIIGFF